MDYDMAYAVCGLMLPCCEVKDDKCIHTHTTYHIISICVCMHVCVRVCVRPKREVGGNDLTLSQAMLYIWLLSVRS